MIVPKCLLVSTLLGTALALPQDLAAKKPGPFEVTNLDIFEPTGRPGDTSRYTVSFGVSDPTDGSSTTCSTDWAYADATTGYPSSYLANCTDASYTFKFVEYRKYSDFKLDVRHIVKKPAPKRVFSAQGLVVDGGNVRCVHSNSGFSKCNQNAEFKLPVYDIKKN